MSPFRGDLFNSNNTRGSLQGDAQNNSQKGGWMQVQDSELAISIISIILHVI